MKKHLLLLLFVSTCSFLRAQDIFNKSNSFLYAKHLVCENNPNLARETLEPHIRLDQMDSSVSLYVHCLFQLQKKDSLLNLIEKVIDNKQIPTFILNQLAAVCISYDAANLLKTIWFNLHPDLQLRYLLLNENSVLVKEQIQKNKHLIDSNFYESMLIQLNENNTPIPKYPIFCSIILPGSGKTLLGNAYEGVLTIFMIGTHSYLSIYAFNTYGANSIFAYTNLLLGTLFYGGNIWGTYHSMVKKKSFELQKIKNEISSNLYPSFYSITCE